MTNDQAEEVLQITQQTLRGVLVALVQQRGIPPRALSVDLDAASADETLTPVSRAMLHDLSEGMRMLANLLSKSGSDGMH